MEQQKKFMCRSLFKRLPWYIRKNIEIENLSKIKLDNLNYLFHAGTREKDKKIFAIGGRVLNFVTLSDKFANARKNINKHLNELSWNSGFYRRDIGYKVIDEWELFQDILKVKRY